MSLHRDEYNRNRNRVMEINVIMEIERANYNQLAFILSNEHVTAMLSTT